jgi:hypothetical protein
MTDKKDEHDKPLDKMTVTELREVAKEIPDITGVHGMKKNELLKAIVTVQGGEPPPKNKPAGPAKATTTKSIQELKKIIRDLKIQRRQALVDEDKNKAKIYRRRISRLKKKTRQAV